MLAERLTEDGHRFASAWNFGPDEADAKPVSWIVEELARAWGNHASWDQDFRAHPQESHSLKLDTSKARTCLNWRPVLPLNRALEWIVEWYKAFQAAANLRRLTQAQIERYEALSQN